MISDLFHPFIVGIFGLLLAGNIFFIKSLVAKIESTALTSLTTSNLVASLSQSVKNLTAELKEIKIEVRSLKNLEIQLAVLEAQVKQQNDQ